MRLHYVEVGEGPLVVLLHGFPDGPDTWRFQRDALAAAGHRVVTPWLRGYGRSAKPRRVSDYSARELAGDVFALARSLGAPRLAALVGHDWGGVIGWHVAARHPELVERLIILNAPHPAALARELRHPRQMARSAYAAFFQLPWLPERLLRAGDLALVRRGIRRMLQRPEAFGELEWEAIRSGLAEAGALRSALHYYRAAARAMLRRRPGAGKGLPTVRTPTLLLWGDMDSALGLPLTMGLERWVPGIVVRHFPHAGHWVHWDEPDEVCAEMLAFLGRNATSAAEEIRH
ncbi:MAG TPA: alpha/beta hydrolase [Gemmatimonadaceae bacterium]|nr:alpha/beta hydrolase [Gemmatimonadaceae bacterium]